MSSEDSFYAYVIIYACGMGTYSYAANVCANCDEIIEWSDNIEDTDEPGWVHTNTDEMLCYTIGIDIAYPKHIKDHASVWETIPKSAQPYFVKTDDTEYGEDVSEVYEVETKWCGALSREAWEDFRSAWDIHPNSADQTMGMITELGHMWALSETHDGMDWNIGGVTPVDFVSVYYCALDSDVMERANVAR